MSDVPACLSHMIEVRAAFYVTSGRQLFCPACLREGGVSARVDAILIIDLAGDVIDEAVKGDREEWSAGSVRL
jgi:hypothetical protein